MTSTLRFYWSQSLFGLREEWSNIWAGFFSYIMFPVYVLILAHMWLRYRTVDNGMPVGEMLTYVGMAEAILMTTLNSLPMDVASGDFSYALARPRSWFEYYSSLILGRNIGRRLIYVAITLVTLTPFVGFAPLAIASARLVLLIPVLALVEVALCFLWLLLQILFSNVSYFRWATIKLLMVVGGVFVPLNELTSSWRGVLLNSPPADFIFQPAYFAVHGQFYDLSVTGWLTRIGVELLLMVLFLFVVFKYARHRQQVFGG